MKQPAKIDVAVLILFFNRPDMLRNLFEQIRLARPSHLLFYQDGARDENDRAKMEACRAIVGEDQIDWECDVHYNYQTKNSGCDPSSYNSIKWAFSLYDKCIKFEDDDVPSQSFFPFCKEMLDRYEHDQRISIISGLNYDEKTPDMPYDYFFTTTFSINGWASWRRVVDQWDDERYAFLDDPAAMRQLEALIKERKYQRDFIRFCQYHRSVGKAYYETLFHASMFFNSGMSIVPRVNMIQNAGATAEGVHYAGSNDVLPKALRRIFTMGRHELEFPLKHPKYVIENVEYKNRMFRIMGWGHPWIKIGRSLEELWLNLRRGNLKHITSALANRIRIWTGRSKWD